MLDLEDKVQLLEDCVLHNSEFSRLALEHEWNRNKRNAFFEIMDKYHYGTQDYTYCDVENDFNKLGVTYEHLKPLFTVFYNNNQYINVITQYLKTNFKSFGNICSEYNEIYADLV